MLAPMKYCPEERTTAPCGQASKAWRGSIRRPGDEVMVMVAGMGKRTAPESYCPAGS